MMKNTAPPAKQAATAPSRGSTNMKAAAERKPVVTNSDTAMTPANAVRRTAPPAPFRKSSTSRCSIRPRPVLPYAKRRTDAASADALPTPGHTDQEAQPDCEADAGKRALHDRLF